MNKMMKETTSTLIFPVLILDLTPRSLSLRARMIS